MTPRAALAFVEKHGVVLMSAKGPVPSLAEAVAGEPIRGSWWGHPKSHAIFRASGAVSDSPDVLVCRLVDGKVTYVHRRLWPALVRLAGKMPKKRLAQIHEEHLPNGKHRVTEIPFPDWVPAEVRRAADALGEDDALEAVGTELASHLSRPLRARREPSSPPRGESPTKRPGRGVRPVHAKPGPDNS